MELDTNLEKIQSEIRSHIIHSLKQIKSQIRPNKKIIAFISDALQYRSHYANLQNLLSDKYNVINITGEEGNDLFEKENVCYFLPDVFPTPLGGCEVEIDFSFIDVVIKTDGWPRKNLSKNAKRIYLPHEYLIAPLSGEDLYNFDYIMIASQPSMDSAIKRIQELAKTSSQQSQICLVPAGYPKLEQNIENYLNISQSVTPQAILYAPTVRELASFINVETSIGFDVEIIQCLLDHFDEPVIWRPHPFHVKYNHINIQSILDHFSGNSRLIYDTNDNVAQTYAQSKLMVTDVSGTAYTYAMTTLKPVVFFSPANDLKHTDQIGFVARNPTQLLKYTQECLSNNTSFADKIRSFRQEFIYNFGHSKKYIAESIDDILSGKQPQGSVTLNY